MLKPIKIILLEDVHIFRDCLAASLNAYPKFEVVGTFADIAGLTASLVKIPVPDIALIDIQLKTERAFGVPRMLERLYPRIRSIWLTSAEEDYVLHRARSENLPGFIHKSDSLAEIAKAVRTVAGGGTYYSSNVRALVGTSLESEDHFSQILSQRQIEVITYLGTGMNLTEIAALLGVSLETVRTHRRDLMRRLNLHTAAELNAYAVRKGFKSPAIR